MSFTKKLVVFLALQMGLCDGLLRRHSLVKYGNARCLDGSPAAYYQSEDSKLRKDHVIIYLAPGGYCYNMATCIQRCILDPHMCTTNREQFLTDLDGLMSSDEHANPHFASYTKIVIPYCTGDMFSGRRFAPFGFYFKGRYIVNAVLTELAATTSLKRVLFTGSSAGGAGVAFNCDQARMRVPKSVDFRCIVDGAFFYPETGSFSADVRAPGMDDILRQAGPLWGFRKAGVFPLHADWWNVIRQPLFLSSAVLDQFGYQLYQGHSDGDVKTWIRDNNKRLRHMLSHDTQESRGMGTGPLGMFVPGCYDHMLLTDPWAFAHLPAGPNNQTLSETLRNWVQGVGIQHAVDVCPGNNLCNKLCANHTIPMSALDLTK